MKANGEISQFIEGPPNFISAADPRKTTQGKRGRAKPLLKLRLITYPNAAIYLYLSNRVTGKRQEVKVGD
jgi:hypothetical protein